MEPFKVLIELGLLDWSCIWLGFNRGWVSRENVYDYAISLLEAGEFSENVAILAGGRYLDEKEFESLILREIKSDDQVESLGMLRSTCRAAAASCNFPGTYSVIGRKVTEKSCTESFFDRFS
ncbi:hypothetical protein H4P02_23240, partial [Pseudomonas lundensis]|nr:hypothetical protein [Pseudomonas lundensis]